ncbi:FixH family protein [Marinovum sp.]|uniref:FixH family protein n=1 Tax=Marinovum sp. TaxID=2024839 RepID=UPI002B2738ED|nr:FixH family protein [Marinovum sp.]
MTSTRPLTGRHVLAIFIAAFGVIIGVNLALAFNAVRTFPGLEVSNSYIASQSFDARRDAQQALGWQVAASARDGRLRLAITDTAGHPVKVARLQAVLGRATHVQDDRTPAFRFDGSAYVADAEIGPGNWNLRITASAPDGTAFSQRVVLRVARP